MASGPFTGWTSLWKTCLFKCIKTWPSKKYNKYLYATLSSKKKNVLIMAYESQKWSQDIGHLMFSSFSETRKMVTTISLEKTVAMKVCTGLQLCWNSIWQTTFPKGLILAQKMSKLSHSLHWLSVFPQIDSGNITSCV